MIRIIGITGGIGTGKSSVLGYFKEFGGPTLEADQIAHQAYRRERRAYRQMVDRWGPEIVGSDGEINRAAVARRVFRQPAELQWLNQLVHPWVKRQIRETAENIAGQPLFCAIPLLYEVGWENEIKQVVCVWCDAETQLARLRLRGWSEDEIRNRLNSQISLDEKAARADFVIINIGSRPILRQQCRQLFQRFANDLAENTTNNN